MLLRAHGTEFARFERVIPQGDGETLELRHSVRLVTFKTKPAEIHIMRQARLTGGRWSSGRWSSWKLKATARSREGALRWHDARGWQQTSGDIER